jgi:predicted RNase H-like HicB family nuclease
MESTPLQKIYFIRAEWDDEAGVWVATSDDVPGLATEADTLEALSLKLESLVPELLDANGFPDGREVPFELLARKFSVAQRGTRPTLF